MSYQQVSAGYEDYYTQFLANNPYPRVLTPVSWASTPHQIDINGRCIINFSSNDYLGLARHPALMRRSCEYVEHYGTGSASSRSVTGNIIHFTEIESTLAKKLGKPAACIMPTGYQANIAVLAALLDQKVLGAEPLIFADRLCHISMLVQTQYLGRLIRFRHNDYAHLALLLDKHKDTKRPMFILAESLYSMDGDMADLPSLITLAQQYQAYLYIDDAHSVGLYGQSGFGLAADYARDIPIIMGTFSKALGGFGGYVGCSDIVKSYLVNHCKGFIYSTALPPAVLGAMQAAIELLPTLIGERQRVLAYAQRVRDSFQEKHMNIGQSVSHIIPWIIGDAAKTRQISQQLLELGVLGAAIQPPSVAPGQSRIRFCLSAAHTSADVDHLLSAISTVQQDVHS